MSVPASIKVVIDPNDIPTVPGKSVFDEWLEQPGNEGKSFSDFIEDIRGPAGSGGGAVKSVSSSLTTSMPSTSSSVFVDSGISVSLSPNSVGSKIVGFVSGVAGIELDGNLVDFTVFRTVDGVSTDIKPSGVSGLCVIRGRSQNATDYPHSFSFGFEDSPGTVDNVTYSLYWRTYNNCECFIGRRHFNDGANVISKAPTFMRVDDVGA